MYNTIKKVSELLSTMAHENCFGGVENIAHNLVVKGVRIPVQCLYCKHQMHDCVDDRYWCNRTGEYVKDDDFCSYGEMREG